MFGRQIIIVLITVIASAGSAYGVIWSSGTVKNSAGSLEYKLWTPTAYKKEKRTPLVVLLHGCMQKAEDIAALSGMNDLADKENFLVVYPLQNDAANPIRCWNWFLPQHQSRVAGEPSLIAAAVKDVANIRNVDATRTFVVGVSAGGAMAVIMAANYPELFAGLGTIAGVQFKAAATVQEGLAVMKQASSEPDEHGLLAFQAMNTAAKKKRMPVIAFHGTKDPYLNPLNTEQLIAQWAKTNDYLDDGKANDSVSVKSPEETKGKVRDGYDFTKFSYADAAGRLLMEKWIVEGLGHAWPGGRGPSQFADAKGPDATAEIWRFFHETTLKPTRNGSKNNR